VGALDTKVDGPLNGRVNSEENKEIGTLLLTSDTIEDVPENISSSSCHSSSYSKPQASLMESIGRTDKSSLSQLSDSLSPQGSVIFPSVRISGEDQQKSTEIAHSTKNLNIPSDQTSSTEELRGSSTSEEEVRRTRNRHLFAFRHLLRPLATPSSSDEEGHVSFPSQKKNIAALLLSRSLYPTRTVKSHDAGCFGMRSWLHRRRWKPCTSVGLDSNRTHTSGTVTCMEFDHQGILLAVADSKGTIRIFDFDEVNNADLMARRRRKGRRDRSSIGSSTKYGNDRRDTSSIETANYRNSAGNFRGATNISSFISFSIKKARVSSIKWNPSNEDQLAVSFFNDADVRLYDLSSSSVNGPFFIRLFRKHTEQGSGNKTLHFLIAHDCPTRTPILTGGTNGTLARWEVPNEPLDESLKSQFVWSLKVWTSKSNIEGISQICELSSALSKEASGLIFVAGDMGSIAFLDINKCYRKAFSTSAAPQVLMTFHLSNFRGLRECNLPNNKWMGVKRAFVLASQGVNELARYTTKTDAKDETIAKKQVNLGIVTNCGWVMLLYIDFHLKTNWGVTSSKVKLLHRGADVSFQNTEGEEVQISDTLASLPEIPTPAACLYGSSFPLVCVAGVKPMCRVLPHKDKSLIDCNVSRMIPFIDQRNSISIMGMEGSLVGQEIGTIVLPNGPAHQLVIHPDNQWIVVSTESIITLFHLHR